MPKKMNPISQEEQSRRFKEKAAELEADGSQSPIDADKLFDAITERLVGMPAKERNKTVP